MRPTTSILLTTSCVILFSLLFITVQPAQAAPGTYIPVTVTQPDGTELDLFASGDEYYNWLHDANGYTVLQDPDTGYYVYADLIDGELVPTALVPNQDDPAAAGLMPQLNIAPERRLEIRREFLALAPEGISNTPKSGTVTDLVVFICFQAPDPCFEQSPGPPPVTEPASKYTSMLNTAASSLRNYFLEASYNQLTIDSLLFPVPPDTQVIAYTDWHPRGYFQPYVAVTNPGGYTGGNNGSMRRDREHILLKDAITYVNGLGEFPSGATVDADGDGYVDDVTFIISGGPTGWASLLWPHAWSLYSQSVYINDKHVYRYQFQMQSMTNPSVLAHESFHVVGAPDLYRYYDGTIDPVGVWDLMASNGTPPQHMSCFMKWKYGNWISSIPEITTAGNYSLNPMSSSGECYRIASPNSTTEYYVLEYRSRTAGTFESTLPASGLLVWRINTAADDGNADGPPDEVYVYRPDGTNPTANGNLNLAYYSAEAGRTAINDSTNPSPFLSTGCPGGLDVDSIGSAGATISFHYNGPEGVSFEISGNAGTPGATLSYTTCAPQAVTADANGDYAFRVPEHWNDTVTPSKTGYTFNPVNRDYSFGVTADQTDQNFTAAEAAQAPTIAKLQPLENSWTCLRPQVGVNLLLTAMVRTSGGSFNPSTVTLKLDGNPVTHLAQITQSVSFPASHATILYTPPANLTAGNNHKAEFLYPSPTGTQTRTWYFTVSSSGTCPTSAELTAPDTANVDAPAVDAPAMAEPAGGDAQPTMTAPVPMSTVVPPTTVPPTSVAPTAAPQTHVRGIPHPGLYRLTIGR